ncbi:SMP-30/gluconolactonase/LRE family protein [Roseovarius sp.]|uniref:SMP-30/gluconolactonase/LRE family protein n=1 Tax=Roseovarius sp. TaxID=1486281 RepID=UPI0035137D9E
MVVKSHTTGAPASLSPNDGVHITCIWPGPALLGECPIWDARNARLLWIDCLGKRIWSADAEGHDLQPWDVPDVIGSIGLCDDGRLIAGFARGFGLIALHDDRTEVEWIGDPDPDQSDTRLNDGKVDAQGRYWCGTMNVDFARNNAALFRLGPGRHWTRVDDEFTVSNGIAFSPDGRRMYFSDSRVDRSYQYDLDPASGALSNRRDFLDTTAYEGRVDGATVDADGCYWGALVSGGAVARFAPDGRLLHKIDLPISCPTMCSFGGPDLDILFVTSATFMLSEAQRRREPLAGSLLAITGLGAHGVRGVGAPRFKTTGDQG